MRHQKVGLAASSRTTFFPFLHCLLATNRIKVLKEACLFWSIIFVFMAAEEEVGMQFPRFLSQFLPPLSGAHFYVEDWQSKSFIINSKNTVFSGVEWKKSSL